MSHKVVEKHGDKIYKIVSDTRKSSISELLALLFRVFEVLKSESSLVLFSFSDEENCGTEA